MSRWLSGTMDASSATAPATTGDATDVPDRERQPPPMRLPCTSRPYAMTSGLLPPNPECLHSWKLIVNLAGHTF